MTSTAAGGALVPGAANFRDVGGLAAGGGRTRPGVLYRSGELARIGDAGRRAIRALGLRRVVDLRADDELRHSPSRIDDLGVETIRVPLFLGSVSSLFEEDLTLADMYRALVTDAAEGILTVVRAVIAAHPVLVHCTAGKDRTGVVVALTLAGAGVDDAAVIADYARSETLIPAERSRAALAWLRARHPDAVNLDELVARSPAPVMSALLAELRDRFDSVPDYLRASGLEEDELRELRRVLVDDRLPPEPRSARRV